MSKLDFLNKVKAPDWFIKSHERIDELKEESSKIVGMDTDKDFNEFAKYLEKAGNKAKTEFEKERLMIEARMKAVEIAEKYQKSGKTPKRELLLKGQLIQAYANLIADASWAQFRYENIDNNFGMAEDLHYNSDTKVISIKN